MKMFWNRDKDKKDNEQNDTGVESTDIARTGTFFRTVSFHPAEFDQAPDGSSSLTLWREAIENPLTNRWRVFEVTKRPNVDTVGIASDSFVVHREILDEAKDLSLDEALENLLKYEQAQTSLGYRRADDTPQDYGNEHVHQFAINEGKAPDVNGNIHICQNGVILSPGSFSEDVIIRVKDAFNNPARPYKPTTPEDPFKQIFSGDAQATDISRLVQKILKRNDWITAVQKMAEVANMVGRMQLQGKMHHVPNIRQESTSGQIRLVEFNRLRDHELIDMGMDLREDYKVRVSWSDETMWRSALEKWAKGNKHPSRPLLHNEYHFRNALAEARQYLKDMDLEKDSDIHKFMTGFLDTMELAVEIAYAKYAFNAVKNEDTDQRTRDHIAQHIEYTLDLYRQQGATDEDIRRLNAEIIGEIKPFTIQDKYGDRRLRYFADRYDLDIGPRHEFNGRGPVIYYPEVIFDFLDKCDEISKSLHQDTQLEQDRIAYKKGPLTDAFTGSADGEDEDQETGIIEYTQPRHNRRQTKRAPR